MVVYHFILLEIRHSYMFWDKQAISILIIL